MSFFHPSTWLSTIGHAIACDHQTAHDADVKQRRQANNSITPAPVRVRYEYMVGTHTISTYVPLGCRDIGKGETARGEFGNPSSKCSRSL